MILLVLAVGAVVLLVVWRRARKATLAGLNSGKPVFSVEPPTRRVGKRKREML